MTKRMAKMISRTCREVIEIPIKLSGISPILGRISDQYVEGENIWVVIDGNYEDKLINYDEIIDLVYGGNYLRPKYRI